VKPKNLEQNGHIDFGSVNVAKPETGSHVPKHKIAPRWSKSAILDQPRIHNSDTLSAEDKRTDTRSHRNGQLV
jgi:hypothetical protein